MHRQYNYRPWYIPTGIYDDKLWDGTQQDEIMKLIRKSCYEAYLITEPQYHTPKGCNESPGQRYHNWSSGKGTSVIQITT